MRLPANNELRRGVAAFAQLATTGLISTLISVLIQLLPVGGLNPATSRLLFLLAVGGIAIFLGATGHLKGRVNSSFVFVFFLCEPMGRVILRRAVAPADLGLALVVGLVAAYFFGKAPARKWERQE